MATPNDLAEKLRQSLINNPTRNALAVPEQSLLNQDTIDQLNILNQRIADANRRLGVSDQKKQRLARVSEEKKQRLFTGREISNEPNPLAGISRDATSLKPSDEVSKALGLQPDVLTGDSVIDEAMTNINKSLLESAQFEQQTDKSLMNAINADLWDSDSKFQQEVINQADFIDTKEFIVLDGDSFIRSDGTQYRLFGVNTPETRKPESWKLTNAEGYSNFIRKANEGYRAYLNYSGQSSEDFTLDNYLDNGEKAKQISQQFFANNPSARMIVIPEEDKSGRGATLVDFVSPDGIKLSDLLRYRPETNDDFYTDQKAIAGYDRANKEQVAQAMRREGINSPSYDNELNDSNAALTIPRYISQAIDTGVGSAVNAASGIVTKVNELGQRLYAGEESAKLENIQKLESKFKEINKEKESARKQFVAGHYDLTKDTYAMAALQKRFKENPNDNFTVKELEALNKTGLQVNYKAFEDTTVAFKDRKTLINTRFTFDNLDDPEVIKRVGKKLINAVKTPKGLHGISELQYKQFLNKNKKDRKLIRDYFDKAVQSNAHLTANAKKHIAQVFDDVKETAILKNSLRDFKDGNWLSGGVSGADFIANAVYDGLRGMIEHPKASMDTISTSLGASAMSIVSGGTGFAVIAADRISQYQDEASKLKGRELTTGEKAIVTLMSTLSAAADAGMAHSIARIGTKLTPANILANDVEFLATGTIGADIAKSIVAEAEKSGVIAKAAAAFNITGSKLMDLNKALGVKLGQTELISGTKDKIFDPAIARILNPKSKIGKIFNSSLGTSANFGKQAVLLGLLGGKNAIVWAAKKAKDLPRWGRTKTALGMLGDFLKASTGESITEAFVQFSEQTAKNVGDWSKNDLKIIAQGAREASAGGFVMGAPSILEGGLHRKKRAIAEAQNEAIVKAAYDVVNATPEKIIENITNTKAKTYNVDKAYDLLFSKEYRAIDRSEADIKNDIGKIQLTLVKEKVALSKVKDLSIEQETRLEEINRKINELTKFKNDISAQFKTDIINQSVQSIQPVIPEQIIQKDDFNYEDTVDKISKIHTSNLTDTDIETAQNLLNQNETKRQIELDSISDTLKEDQKKLKIEGINKKYNTFKTRLESTINRGSPEVLTANQRVGVQPVIPLSIIKEDDFDYIETANRIVNTPVERLTINDISSAHNLLDQNEIKRQTELSTIKKTDTPELIKLQEEQINKKYDELETKLKTAIKQGSQQILIATGLKSNQELNIESVNAVNDSYSRQDITKFENNLKENLIPKTTNVFGSTQTERDNHRDFLEAIINNKALSADVKNKATSMLKLLNQFDQSAQNVKELEKNANANKIALRSGENKTIFTVFQDVLSATTNTAGKLGLKGYIDSITNALVQGKIDQVEAATARLDSWVRGHKEKVIKLKQAIQKVNQIDRGSITVKLSDSSATLEIFAGNTKPAELLLKYMSHEVKLMELSQKAIKQYIQETKAIAKKDSEQINQLGVISDITASNIINSKFEAKRIKNYFDNDNVRETSITSKQYKEILIKKRLEIAEFIQKKINQLKAKEQQYKDKNLDSDNDSYKKLHEEISLLENHYKIIKNRLINPNRINLDNIRLLANYYQQYANDKLSNVNIKADAVNELQRANLQVKQKPEKDNTVFKTENRKNFLIKKIKEFIKKGTSIKVSEIGLKDNLKSVEAGVDIGLTALEKLYAHLRDRYNKTPLRRASRAVVRKHFATVATVLNFLKPYNLNPEDVRKIASLVSDKSIDTTESLFKKLNELELKDKNLIISLIKELITNESKTLIETKKVNLTKEKIDSKELTLNSDITLDENTTNEEMVLKAVIELFGKDNLLTKLLFEQYAKEDKFIFKKLIDALLTSIENNDINSQTVKKVRILLDSNGIGANITDNQLLQLLIEIDKYNELVNLKKSIVIKETITEKNKKDITENIFKSTKNFKTIIDSLLENNIITQEEANLSLRKYNNWFNKQNKIRLEKDAYHENPKIRSEKDIINQIKLPVKLVSIIASLINSESINQTKKQLTYTTSTKKITKIEEDYIDVSANEDFIIEYDSEFNQEISDLLNYVNGNIETLINLVQELKSNKVLSFKPTTTDTTKEKPPTEGQIIRQLESIIKRRLRSYNFIPDNIKDAKAFINMMKKNEGILLNYKYALELYKKRNRALLTGDIDTAAKLSAQLEANKNLTVEQFMEGYEIVGLGKSKEQKIADIKFNKVRKKQGLAPIKRPKGYYNRNTKLIEAIRTMLYGGSIDSKYLKESEEFRKAKKAYDEYIEALTDILVFDTNQLVIEKSKDRFRLKRRKLANQKQVIVDYKENTATELLESGFKFNKNTFDRIIQLESIIRDQFGNTIPFKQKKKIKGQVRITKDTINTQIYDSLLRRIVARFRSNSDITAEAVFFYNTAYRRRVITKEFRDSRIKYIKNNPKGNNSIIGTIAKDHIKLTGKEHRILKQLYKHDSIEKKLKKKNKINIGVKKEVKKLIKTTKEEASIKLTELKTNILETRVADSNDTNIPTKIGSLQQIESYDLIANPRKHYGENTARQVFDIIQHQMVDLSEYVYEVGNSNKENMPNSVIPSKEMFTVRSSHTKAPLIAKLYGLLDGLANSEKSTLIYKDIDTKNHFEPFRKNSALFDSLAKVYKQFNLYSDVIYGNIDSNQQVLPTHLSEASEDVLRAFYSKETGKIHNQIVEVASIAFWRYYSSEMLGTIDNSPDAVKSLFNIKDEETLPDKTYNFGRSLGTLSAPVIQRLGRDMAFMLNLKIKHPEQYANGNLEEAFHAALGNYAIEMAKEAGFIQVKSIQNKILDNYKRGRGNQLIGELSDNPNAYTDFIHVNTKIDNETQIRIVPDNLFRLSEDFKEFKGNKFIKDLTGVTYTEQFVTKKPVYKKEEKVPVKKSIPGQKAPSLMTEMTHTASQIEWKINQSIFNDLNLFGATVLSIINDVENPDEHIEALRIPIESKARTVDTSIGYIINILNETNKGNPIYFENNVTRNLRVSQEAGATRTDKNVRMLMEQVGARVELNVTNPDDFRLLQQSLAVAFDVEYSDKWQEQMNEFFWLKNGSIEYHPDIMAYFDLKDRGLANGVLLAKPETELRPTKKGETDKDGKAITKPTWEFTDKERDLYINGTEEAKAQAGWKPHVLAQKNELSTKDATILAKAIDLTDGGHMGLQALSELHAIYHNYKVNKTSKNLVYAPREIDGKTHGPVAVSWMMASGKLGHSGGMETFSKVIDVMKRGGIVEDTTIQGIYEVFDKDSKDNYKKLTDVAMRKLSSILSDPRNTKEDVEGTKAIIGILSKSSQVSVAKNTIAEPTADKVSTELERDFFKFILIAVIYGSSLNGILDSKVSELEKAVYKRYSEINNSNNDVFKTELKAFNETVKKIYGSNTIVPTTRKEVNQFKFNAREINNSYFLMKDNIGKAIDYANKIQLGSAMKGISIINSMASVQATITKLEEKRLTTKAIKKKAERLGIDAKFVTLTKKERDIVIAQLIKSGMMASYPTPSSKGYEEEMMFMEQETAEIDTKMIVKDKTGRGIQFRNEKGRKDSKKSKTLPLEVKVLKKETSVLPGMVQAMIIDSHIQGALFKLFKQGKLSTLDHVYDASLISTKVFKDAAKKGYINPGKAMNKALWDIERNWNFHEEIEKRLTQMLKNIKANKQDIEGYQEAIEEAFNNPDIIKQQEGLRAQLLKQFQNQQKVAKLELIKTFLLRGEFDYKKNDEYRIAIKQLAKKEAIFKHQLEKGYSTISMWKDEIDMHLLDISITKNHFLRTIKTVDNFPDVESAYQIPDSERPAKLSIEKEMQKLADKGNRIAQWNIEHPNAKPLKTLNELNNKLKQINKVAEYSYARLLKQFNDTQDVLVSKELDDYIKKFDIVYQKQVEDSTEEFITSLDQLTPVQLEALNKPQKTFRNNLSNKVKKFVESPIRINQAKIKKKALKIHNYKAMPEKTPKQIIAKRYRHRQYNDLVNTLIKKEYMKQQELRNNLNEIVAYNIKDEKLLEYLDYNSVEITDQDIEKMFSVDDRDTWTGWEKYQEVARSKFNKFGITNSNSATTFKSNPGGARLGVKRETHRVNGNNVLTLFDSITFTGGKQESKAHIEYLRNYLEESLVPLLNELDEYVHLDVHEGGDTNSGENTGAIVKLNYTNKQSRYSSHDMSQQEIFAHEFAHIFWSKMLENGSDAYMELRDLQEKALDAITEVMKDKGLPPEAIFYPRDKAGNIEFYHSESNEKIAAKEKFDYIFKSENGIYEFAVFAETNEVVRNAFQEHKVKNPKKTGILELLKSIWAKLIAAFSNGHKLGKLKGDQTIDARLKEIKRYAENEYRKNLMIETNRKNIENNVNDKLASFIANKVTKGYVKFMQKTYKPRTNAIEQGKNLSSLTKKYKKIILSIPLIALNKRYGKEFQKLHDLMINNRRNFAYQFFKEIKSNNKKKQAQADLLHKGTSVNQRINQNIINATVKNVVEAFSDGSNFTAKDWDNLNETVIRGELYHIYQNMGMEGLMSVLENDIALVDAIDLYKRNIIVSVGNSGISNIMLAQAESLANFTAHGEPTIRNHAMNAHVIAQQMLIPNKLRKHFSKKRASIIEKDLEVLVSLQHLATMEPTALENAKKIIRKEYDSNRGGNNGIVNMMALHYASYQEVISAGFADNKTQLIRGHSKEDIDLHRKIMIAPLSKAKELKQKYGMELYKETGNKNGLFFSKFNTEAEWQNGSFAYNTEGTNKGFDIKDYYHDVYDGDTVNDRLRAAYEHIERLNIYRDKEIVKLYRGEVPTKPRQIFAPTLANNGDVTSYRTIINHKIKREVLNMKTHAAKSVAHNVSDNLNKTKSKETNREISKLIYEQWRDRNQYPNSLYVELDPNSTDPEIAEISQMIPSEDWDYLESLFGKGNPIMITDSLIPLVFGFRKGGLIEFFNKKSGYEMNAHLRKYLHYSARFWQAGVAEWKRTVVLLTPSTWKNNFLSNTVVLRIRGLTGSKAARDQVEGLKFITQYIKDTDELISLQLKEYSNTATKDDLSRIKALIKHITNNPVSPLIEKGAYSPNVEDITIKENKIKQVYESIVPKELIDTINDIIDSIPEPVKRIASNFYITRDTVASDMLTYTTQVSDFVARYALYKKYTQEDKMDSDEAIKAVIKQFVSYDENTSVPLQWLNDNGVWNFSKYALRSAQTVVDLYKDKPANMLMYHLLDSLTDNPIPNPTQSFIGFNGIQLNGASIEDIKESLVKPALFNYIPSTPIFD